MTSHPHSVMNFPSLSGSPTGQLLHSNHFSSVFSDCAQEPPLDLNFEQKFSQNNQRAQNEFELIPTYLQPQNEATRIPHVEVTQDIVLEAGLSINGVQDKVSANGMHEKVATEGAPKATQRSRCHWSHGEVMALFDAKKAESDRSDIEMPGKKVKFSQERWDGVAEFVKTKGCSKSAAQCKDKWEKIWPMFRKIFDWEKQVSSGKPSYWTMLGDEREQEGFPRGFDKELYDAMAARFGPIKSMDISSIIVDSSNEDSAADFGNEPVENDAPMFEDGPMVGDGQTLVSSSKKRKMCNSLRATNPVKTESAKVSKELHCKRKSVGLAERKLSLEEKKVKLAEKRFYLEEKKLEATIEIGKGLIASMEKMTQTISSIGSFTSHNS